jgi:predicted RNA-binding Zn-ribbon protein involved in translation (DUF1610 family)
MLNLLDFDYDPVECPKCGESSAEFSVSFVDGLKAGYRLEEDYLEHSCPRCGWAYKTKTKDAPK